MVDFSNHINIIAAQIIDSQVPQYVTSDIDKSSFKLSNLPGLHICQLKLNHILILLELNHEQI